MIKGNKRMKAGCKKIAVVGATENVGVTHFSIMLASYLATFTRKKVRIVTVGGYEDYKRLNEVYNGLMIGLENEDRIEFYIGKIHFLVVKDADIQCDNIISKTCQNEYEHVIYDIGIIGKSNSEIKKRKLDIMKKFSMCDFRFLIGNVNPWKQKLTLEFIDGLLMDKYQGKWKCLYVFGDDENAKMMQRDNEIFLNRIPICHDPFKITADVIKEMENILLEE